MVLASASRTSRVHKAVPTVTEEGFPMSASNLDLPVLMSADQIRRREFVAIRRGYDPGQVREFLEQVADHVQQMESLLQEVRLEADSAIRAASKPRGDPYAKLAERVAGVLRAADDEAEKLRRVARTEAERALSEARADAERIRSQAEASAGEARAEAERALREARSQADRTITGLATKREALLEQLASMQERLLGVAHDLAATISAPDLPEPPEPLEPALPPPASAEARSDESPAWAVPSKGIEQAESADEAADEAEGEVQAEGEDEAGPRADVQAGAEPSGAKGEAASKEDGPVEPQAGSRDRNLEGLWEGTDAIGLQIPEIPQLDLDWGESSREAEEDE